MASCTAASAFRLPAIPGRPGFAGRGRHQPAVPRRGAGAGQWAGDRLRDAYEMELLHEFMEAGKPVLGICRGAQLINVALGGTLYQDIATQYDQPDIHVHDDYDKYAHAIAWETGSNLARLSRKSRRAGHSIHHQAIKSLGRGLRVEARSTQDGLIEAVRLDGKPYVLGLQWHPVSPAGQPRSAQLQPHPRRVPERGARAGDGNGRAHGPPPMLLLATRRRR